MHYVPIRYETIHVHVMQGMNEMEIAVVISMSVPQELTYVMIVEYVVILMEDMTVVVLCDTIILRDH